MTRTPWLFLLAATAGFGETPPDPRELMRRALGHLEESDRKLGDYDYTRRNERREFTGNGAVKSDRSWVFEGRFEDGFRYQRLVERDGKPIPEEERQKNEQTLRKRLAELKAMPPQELQKRREQQRKRQSENGAFLQEFPDALDYKLVGEETLDGRAALVLECSPRPGYKARNLRARIFEKTRGRAWIDKADSELAKADVEVFDTVSIGWGVLGRIEKGTRFFIERRKIGDDWLASAQTIRFAARLMLVKSLSSEITTRYSEFRKRTDAAAREGAGVGIR